MQERVESELKSMDQRNPMYQMLE